MRTDGCSIASRPRAGSRYMSRGKPIRWKQSIPRQAPWPRLNRMHRPMASEFRQADVFDFLSRLDRKYSMVVLDPPAFAKSRKQLDDAARGYKEINLRALRLLEPGGVLVTCSCSHHFSESMLLETVAAAGLEAGKTLRILERRTQAADHPIALTIPETLYLKCLILQVLAL
jgi:23S rRNA (cytosine1962-C5)-methyltransferase